MILFLTHLNEVSNFIQDERKLALIFDIRYSRAKKKCLQNVYTLYIYFKSGALRQNLQTPAQYHGHKKSKINVNCGSLQLTQIHKKSKVYCATKNPTRSHGNRNTSVHFLTALSDAISVHPADENQPEYLMFRNSKC